MAIIPKFFFDAVVAIGIEVDKDIKWIGTGFLVGRKEPEEDAYTIFLITNHHIIEEKENIIVRFNKKGTLEYTDYNIKLEEQGRQKYSKHENADVIAVQISPSVLRSNNSEYNYFCLDKHSLNLEQMNSTDVIEGAIVYSLGFPINMVGSNRKSPICRMGCISRISNLFNDDNENEYLLDLQTIPGSSGAPIINRPETLYIEKTSHNESANLIGIISGTIDYSEKCSDENCDKEHEKNSGFTIAHPVDVIVEVVEQEYKRRCKENE